ncbi:nitroreductase family deazaflavin-dependent oxidoreductase [Kutzneria sp. NPDC051319]|uniref:nitroreductase family deazaflavin-dependent oxidoreductase n=1 Tax=Kutzneria sp. NPDC051319 TaxID=3155047 RepID=UPI003444F863
MPDFDNPIDVSGGDWIEDHLRRYLATDGADGHIEQGATTLLLTTIGRRSGQARRTPLIYGRDGDDVLLVASKGGSPKPPLWYSNLQGEPRARVQILGEVFDVVARDADADEKPRLWKHMTSIWPAYDDYQAKTDRDIPIVILRRV